MANVKTQAEALSVAARDASDKVEKIAAKAVSDMQEIMNDFSELPTDIQLPSILNAQGMIAGLQMKLAEAQRARDMATPAMPVLTAPPVMP